jgi:hypothetical protein
VPQCGERSQNHFDRFLLALSSVSVNALSANGKQTVCHEDKEISVANSAVSAHEKHGDTLGECDEEKPEPDTVAAVVMVRCEGVVGNGVEVVSASSSVDVAVILPFPEEALNCPDVLAKLLISDARFKLTSITSGSTNSGEEDDEDLHLYTDYLLIGKVPADN